MFFNHLKDARLIKELPPYGTFEIPSKKSMRLERKRRPKKAFTPEQFSTLLRAADTIMQAMMWLGINAACGNTDCGVMVRDEIDLDGGWLKFIREKTGNDRRCPLWPETVADLAGGLGCAA